MVCAPVPMESILVSELESSEAIVLAKPLEGAGEGRYEILKVLKNQRPIEPAMVVEAALPFLSVDAGKIGVGKVLLTRVDDGEAWVIRGPASEPQHVEFYEEVLSLPQSGGQDPLGGAIRANYFVKFLHHEDALLAKAAAVEMSKASYSALRGMKTRLDAAALRAALGNPALVDRFPLYHTMLGICGGPDDVTALEQNLARMWQGNRAMGLGAMLTAVLELKGEVAVAEIEQRYFYDQDRTLAEIEQAVLALRLHGNANAAVSRERVIQAFHGLVECREPLAFMIIEDLARWGDWSFRERLVDVVARHGNNILELRQALAKFLVLCPTAGTVKADAPAPSSSRRIAVEPLNSKQNQ